MSKLSAQILSLIDREDDRKMMTMEDENAHLWRRIRFLENSLVLANVSIKKKREQLNSIISKYSVMRDKVIGYNSNMSSSILTKKRPIDEVVDTQGKKRISDVVDKETHIDKQAQMEHIRPKSCSSLRKLNSSSEVEIENINVNTSNISVSNIKTGIPTAANASYVQKCIEVVRNKAARASLPGHECEECKRFYSAMIEQGIYQPGEKMHMLKECSRHKARWFHYTSLLYFWHFHLKLS